MTPMAEESRCAADAALVSWRPIPPSQVACALKKTGIGPRCRGGASIYVPDCINKESRAERCEACVSCPGMKAELFLTYLSFHSVGRGRAARPLSDRGTSRVSEIKRWCLFIVRVINTGLPRYIYLHKKHK